jgi:small-conductance mechanosensitive channel
VPLKPGGLRASLALLKLEGAILQRWNWREGPMDGILSWLKQYSLSFETALATTALLIAAAAIILFLNRLMARSLHRLEQRLSLPYETLAAAARLVTGVLWLITALLVLSLWGVSVSGLWTLLVSAAAVIGVGFLAVWTMISNVTASLFITIWRPFHLGHTVELLPESLKGRAIDRNMMYTIIREESGALLHVPNNLFFQKMFRVSGSAELSHFERFEGRNKDSASSER